MCLGIPGRILESYASGGLRMARVQFGGIVREACLQYVPQAQTGDYVVVHVGFAISRLDEAEAARTYKLLQELGQLTELDAPMEDEARSNASLLHSDGSPSFPRKRESRKL
jgi:hydrogenase expression/formation protein HypC